MRIVQVSTPEQFEAALAIRHEVFVVEQGVPPEEERDEFDRDPSTAHVLAIVDGAHDLTPHREEVLGTGRLLAPGSDGSPHVGRVAVVARARGLGVGRAILDELERIALERHGEGGAVVVALAAQTQAIPFYESIGYHVHGERFLDAGIWHREAIKTLQPPVETHPGG